MKKEFFLSFFILLSLVSVVNAKNIPLKDFWANLGFCKDAEIYRQGYISVKSKSIYGDFWKLNACKKIDAADFKKSIKDRNFHLLVSSEDTISGFIENKNGRLYFKFNLNEEPLILLQQNIFDINREKEHILDLNDGDVNFYLNYPKGKYLSMHVEILNSTNHKDELAVDFKAYGSIKEKDLKTEIQYTRKISSSEGINYLYDLPVIGGLQRWSVENNYNSEKSRVKVKIVEEGSLVKIGEGDKIGGIILKSVPYGMAKVVPEKGAQYFHKKIVNENYTGDLTPQGDVVFWLPKGYWELQIKPFEKHMDETPIRQINSHIIPVFPGYLTEVNWPASIERMFTTSHDIRMEILNVEKENGKTFVDFYFINQQKVKLRPKVKELSIIEGGLKGEILEVKRIQTPPEIVILLDSSGSMKGSMKKALNSVEKFLKGLSENSVVTLIDFDTKPKIIAEGSPKLILASLKKIRANGATALYDALVEGISLLEKSNRPTLILFTDGKDSNWNDTGPGSKTTLKDTLDRIKNINFPVFTIGFGETPDIETLNRIASLSGGAFYEAKDIELLDDVFKQIKNNLGNQWRIYYKQPKIAAIGEKPVLTLVVDNSASMLGKLESLRKILHDFIKKLPSDFLIQLFIFSDDIYIKQVLTDNKLAVFRGLSEMKELGGTNILGSLKTSYDILHAIPSSNKYLVYITDEALQEDGKDNKEKLKLILKKLKDDGVKSLFVGMVKDDKKEVFKNAAKYSGGKYILSPDPLKMKDVLDNFLEKINNNKKKEDKHIIRVVYKSTDKFGRSSLYSAAAISSVNLPKSKDKIKNLEGVSWIKTDKLKPYDGELSRLITGDDAIGREVEVVKRLPLDVSYSNKAVKITLKEAVFLSKLRGVRPSRGKYLALTLKVENILKPQKVIVYPNGSSHPASWLGSGAEKNARIEKKIPDYLIPEVKLHFFLSLNNKTSFPVSDATYLAETPLILPGEDSLYVRPVESVVGTLIFLIPDEFLFQSALHFYDTAYGHIDIPISGVLDVKKEDIEKLPQKVNGKLSDTFSLDVAGAKDVEKIFEYEAEYENIYRIIEADLISKVQAHLAINPKERFFLAVDTKRGPLIFKLHPITQRIPFGFYQSRLVTPGSFNKARLVFEIPKNLKSNPYRLVVDIKGGGLNFPIKAKELQTTNWLANSKAKGADIYINGIYNIEDSNEIIVDATISDIQDDASTAVSDFLMLDATKEAKERFKKEKISIKKGIERSKGLGDFANNVIKIVEGDITPVFKDYITAFPAEVIVLNGQKRRGFLFFPIPPKTKPSDFVIKSAIFKDLSVCIKDAITSFKYEKLLTRNSLYEEDDSTFKEELSEKINQLMRMRNALGFKKPGSIKVASINIEGKKDIGLPKEVPSLLVKSKDIKDIKTVKDLKKYLKSNNIKIRSSNWRAWRISYAPEAALTQGWMSENDLAFLTERVLNRQQIETERVTVSLTKKGKEKLKEYFASKSIELSELPAIKYEDNNGDNHTIVIPFFKERYEIPALIKGVQDTDGDDASVSIEVIIKAKPINSGRMEALKEVSDALAGDEKEDLESITILQQKIELKTASLGALSLGFTEIMDVKKGKVIKAIMDSPDGRNVSEDELELAKYQPKEVILKFYTPDKIYKTIRALKDKEWPTDLFFVVGLNVPDLPEQSLEKANSHWLKEYKQTQNIDTLSSLKWLGQGIIARFVGAQTIYNNDLTQKLDVESLYIKDPKIIVVGFRVDKENDQTVLNLDLVQPYPQIRGEEKSKKRFNLLSGFYYSSLESKAVPKGVSALELLSTLSKDTKLLLFLPENRYELSRILKESEYPRFVWEQIEESDNFVLFPEKPLQLANNKLRVAWLEIDPETNKIWSFLDSGERGVVDTQIGEGLALSMDYMMGFWIGIQNSVWSTAGFSLILADWNQIKRCAHGFAVRLGSYLESAADPTGALKLDSQKVQAGLSGDYSGMVGVSNMDDGCIGADELKKIVQEHAESKSWSVKDVKGIIEGSKQLKDLAQKSWETSKEKYLGFANGYKDGVNWYFK